MNKKVVFLSLCKCFTLLMIVIQLCWFWLVKYDILRSVLSSRPLLCDLTIAVGAALVLDAWEQSKLVFYCVKLLVYWISVLVMMVLHLHVHRHLFFRYWCDSEKVSLNKLISLNLCQTAKSYHNNTQLSLSLEIWQPYNKAIYQKCALSFPSTCWMSALCWHYYCEGIHDMYQYWYIIVQ